MPPKRLRRHSPAASGPAAGERIKRAKLAGSDYSAWGWVGSEVTDASEISQSHRLASCGFSTNTTFPLCINEYSSSSGKSMPAQSALQKSQGKVANGELEDDIIVISDDEGPSCSSKACKSNPYCLNYLGQEKWEDEGVSPSFVGRQQLTKSYSTALYRQGARSVSETHEHRRQSNIPHKRSWLPHWSQSSCHVTVAGEYAY